MFEQIVDTSDTPRVTVECLGNLTVRGTEAEQITIHAQGKEDEATLEREGDAFTLTSSVDCSLTCPAQTTLTVQAAQGNLSIKGVSGPVAISAAHGNTKLRAVGPVALEQTFGNLNVQQVEGELNAQVAKGNVRARQVGGALTLGQVDGNLAVEGVQGDLTAAHVWGNIRLGPPFSAGAVHRLNCAGNLTIRLPADADIALTLSAGGGIRSTIPGLDLEEGEDQVRGVLGTGAASLEAQVSGRIFLRPAELEADAPGSPLFDLDLDGLGAQVEAIVAGAMAEAKASLRESLGRMDNDDARRKVKRAAEKARRKAAQEAEKARMRAERAERRWQRASGRRPRPKQEVATDEERMQVLHLVEEGNITPEQAADLLAALEGR